MPYTQAAATVEGMAHLSELLDLDVEVLHEYHRDVIDRAASLVPAGSRVVDLGAGSGAGAVALARRLPEASVVAVDVDEPMLEHLRHRAEAAGVGDRVRTVRADLDRPWPELGPADLVWASASLHHLADPAAALAQVRTALRPGGVLAVTELDSFPRFLTGTTGAALEERCHAVLAERRAEAGLHVGDDWAARLTAAGFTIEGERRYDIVLRPPLPAAAGRYAQVSLRRMREGLDGRLGDADLAALDAIVASVEGRDDLTVTAARTAWLARVR
jgi:SAM-dependent methyltransferase